MTRMKSKNKNRNIYINIYICLNSSFWCWNLNIPREQYQCYGSWFPGYWCCHNISSYHMYCLEWTSCHPRGKISTSITVCVEYIYTYIYIYVCVCVERKQVLHVSNNLHQLGNRIKPSRYKKFWMPSRFHMKNTVLRYWIIQKPDGLSVVLR